jgi:hypothetical protein
VTYGFARGEFSGIELTSTHTRDQIVLVQRGEFSCEVEGGLWIVPPRSTVWIPGGALHAVKATGAGKLMCTAQAQKKSAPARKSTDLTSPHQTTQHRPEHPRVGAEANFMKKMLLISEIRSGQLRSLISSHASQS